MHRLGRAVPRHRANGLVVGDGELRLADLALVDQGLGALQVDREFGAGGRLVVPAAVAFERIDLAPAEETVAEPFEVRVTSVVEWTATCHRVAPLSGGTIADSGSTAACRGLAAQTPSAFLRPPSGAFGPRARGSDPRP